VIFSVVVVVVVVDIDGGVGVVPRRRRRAAQGGSTLLGRCSSGSTRAEGAGRILSSDSPRGSCASLPPSRRGARERTCRDDEASDTFGRGDKGDQGWCVSVRVLCTGDTVLGLLNTYCHQASGPVKAGGIHEGPAGFDLHVSPLSISSQVPCECEREGSIRFIREKHERLEGSSEFRVSLKRPAVYSSTGILTLCSRSLLIPFAGKTRENIFRVFSDEDRNLG